MTIAEVLKSSQSGKLPRVFHKDLGAGQIVCVKQGTTVSSYFGVAVQFDGKTYDTWFYENDGTDGRCKYMKDLVFAP